MIETMAQNLLQKDSLCLSDFIDMGKHHEKQHHQLFAFQLTNTTAQD